MKDTKEKTEGIQPQKTKNSTKQKSRMLCEAAIMIGISTALGFVKLIELPQGGSVGIGMIPIFIFCRRWGLSDGLKMSFACGILQLLLDGAYAWGPTSMIFDYILAYGILGIAGAFNKNKGTYFAGVAVACFARFLMHFVSGVTIYRIYEPTQLFNRTLTNPYIYSAIYNGSFVGIDMLLCLVILFILEKPLGKYLKPAA